MLFQPSREEVRGFFQTAWKRHLSGEPLEPLQMIAADWIAEHPEYHRFMDSTSVLEEDFTVEAGGTNPFLHLAMHLSIAEQMSIDQPHGIRKAMQDLAARRGSLHEAMHDAMECLGEMLWTAQRSGLPPDPERYLECLRRRASPR